MYAIFFGIGLGFARATDRRDTADRPGPAQREAAERERLQLAEQSQALEGKKKEVTQMVGEAEAERAAVLSLAELTALEAEAVKERQRQLKEQAAELLQKKAGDGGAEVPTGAAEARKETDKPAPQAATKVASSSEGLGLEPAGASQSIPAPRVGSSGISELPPLSAAAGSRALPFPTSEPEAISRAN